MELTVNQRFTQATDYIKNEGIVSSFTQFAETIGWDLARFNYLKRKNGGKLTVYDVEILNKNFPQINWRWVTTGEENMLASYSISSGIHGVSKEAAESLYPSKPEHLEMLNKIITGTSRLPIAEQNSILIKEVLTLQQKIISQKNIYEQSDLSLLLDIAKEMKNKLIGK